MDKQRSSPPSGPTRFLAWFLKEDYYEDIQGDLEEEFQIIAKGQTLVSAKKWYTWQIMRLFKPNMMKKVKAQDSIEKETTMFKNYFKIGIRNLWKYKASTVINVIGLSTGIAAFVLISLFVKDELSYDKNHEHGENIYRVTVKNYTRAGDMSRQWAFASAGHAERLKEDYTDISHSVRFHPWVFPDIDYDGKKFPSEQVVFAGNDVFDIFTFNFIEGNKETAFQDLFSLVLTEATAVKIFGNDWRDQNIIGKQVVLAEGDDEAPFKVTGVMENMPAQQHFHFDYLAPIRFLEPFFGEEGMNNVSGNYNWLTYVRMSPNTNIPSLTDQINDEFWDKYIGKFETGEDARAFYDFEFQPLLDIHLTSNLEGEIETNGSMQILYIFSAVGFLLLLVACVNYMNIATSHYSRRMKEVGVRKVIGAFKSSLIKQFLTESTLITIISLPLILLIVIWFLPYFNEFIMKEMTFNPLVQLDILFGLLALLIAVGFIAGLYPALFLSKVNLVQALKGEQAMNASKWNFRSWLVTFQYAVTIALIFAIAVMESQMKFIRNSDPGYDRERVLSMNLPRNANLQTFKTELLSNPNILNVSYSSRIPTGRLMDNWGSQFFQGDSAVSTSFRLPMVSVDKDFLDTYEIAMIAGDKFREGMMTAMADDTTTVGYYIINETAAKALGFKNAGDVVGERLAYGPTEGRIVGVMSDFHFESMHREITPMIILYREQYRRVSIKLAETDVSSTLDFIESTFDQFDLETTANYRFVDELFEQQYIREHKTGQAIKVFAGIAILIGCLGLIGMVGFIIETKLKEIGVRKVLGASTHSIWMLIGSRFIILIVVAFSVALPLTYWLMNGWLDNFVYRTSIPFLMILLPIGVAGLLTFLATFYQILKASRVNPVECLKDE